MHTIRTKAELKGIMKRFLEDKQRGISVELFSDLCGLSPDIIKKCFLYETMPVSERTQILISKGYDKFLNGEIAIMQNRDRSKFVQFRKEAKPVYTRHQRLAVIDGKVQISLGIKNRRDYSQESLDEQLKRG